MESPARYEKFLSSGQPKLRLRIALEEAFCPETAENHRKAYLDYIKTRIRPAAELLVEKDDAETLEALDALGLLTESILESAAEEAARLHSFAALACVLQLKQRRYGYQKPDFSL